MTSFIIILGVLLILSFIAIALLAKKLFVTQEQLIRTSAELQTNRQIWEDRQNMLDQTSDSLKCTFHELSHQALKQSQEDFLRLAQTRLTEQQKNANLELDSRKQAITSLLEPVTQGIQFMNNQLHEIEKTRCTAFSALNTQIENITQTHRILQQETSHLSHALRHQSARGRWGELQLQRVVELAGMTEHCDFTTQEQRQNDESTIRPDMVIRLPQDKTIIIDAKAPMSAYLLATECEDAEQRQQHLKTHARQVRDHIQKLSQKSYYKQFEQTPEFVVMFLPGESIFQAALQGDPSLIEVGSNHQVIMATPSTLIALLKTISYAWQQEAIAENAQLISQAGASVYDSCMILSAHFNKLGKSLNQAVSHFNSTNASMKTNLVRKANHLQTLGVTGKKKAAELPPHIEQTCYLEEAQPSTED